MRKHGFGSHLDRSSRVILALIAALALLAWGAVWLATPGAPRDPEFVIASGDSIDNITSDLVADGVVRSRIIFKIALRASGLATKLQPGTYDLSGIGSYPELIARLSSGGVAAKEFVLRVIEGWDLRDIRAALEKAGYARADELYQVTGVPATDYRALSAKQAAAVPKPEDFSAQFAFLKGKPAYVSLEGFLFPDTYRLFRDATPEDIVAALLSNFDRKLTPEMRADIATRNRTLYQAVTLASVVEREVSGSADRRMVADIFWRRLDAGMALQSDATVNYVTGGSTASVSLADTKNVSRYNTYLYPGLPLGPVGNPGLSALEAAIDPTPNQYWYFLTDKDGNVHYARTLAEHNANRARYLR